MNDEIETKNPDKMKGDLVVFKNPTTWNFVDKTPNGRTFTLKANSHVIIPKTLAIWFIGDYESPFWKQGPGTRDEIKAIYSRNRYHEIFCRVTGEAPFRSEVAVDEEKEPFEEVEDPKKKLEKLIEKPEVVLVTTDHLNKSDPADPDRMGGPEFA